MSEDNFEGTFESEDSDSIMINLGEIKEASFEAIPKGLYQAVVEECEFQISKNSGSPMWNLRYSITDGEFANRKIFQYMSFSEKALPYTKPQIGALEPSLLEGAFNPKKVAEDGTLIGKTCTLRVAIEKGQDDEDRNVVKGVKPAASGDGF